MVSNKAAPYPADLSALLKGLCTAGVEFIIVGGLAAVVQGAPITTFDLDIVHRQSGQNIKRLMKFFKSVDAYQRRPDDKIIIPIEADFKEKGHLQLRTRHGPIDVLAYIEKEQGFDDLLASTVEIKYHGQNVYVLSLEKILDLKRDSNDSKDRFRMPILEETLRQLTENDTD